MQPAPELTSFPGGSFVNPFQSSFVRLRSIPWSWEVPRLLVFTTSLQSKVPDSIWFLFYSPERVDLAETVWLYSGADMILIDQLLTG